MDMVLYLKHIFVAKQVSDRILSFKFVSLIELIMRAAVNKLRPYRKIVVLLSWINHQFYEKNMGEIMLYVINMAIAICINKTCSIVYIKYLRLIIF